MTIIRAALPVKCPECGTAISWREAGPLPFHCSRCGQGLRLRINYFRVLYILAGVIVTLLCRAAGLRGDTLFAVVLLGLWPMHLLLVFITMRLFPPDVEPTGDFRAILFGAVGTGEAETDRELVEETGTTENLPRQRVTAVAVVRWIIGDPAHWTFEGVVLRGSAIVLVLWLVWTAMTPLIHRFVPKLAATRQGPAVFPLKAQIGGETIAFTNGATDSWVCTALLGVDKEYAAGFGLDPGQTRQVSYAAFEGTTTAPPEPHAVRYAAWEEISAVCVDSLDRPHSVTLR